ncbi:BLLF2 [macacine gammaherpesvirus 10]|uniref:BLLF2 n=1 Tax=macacine gammaherpesvirus 10 TaxID=2560569 RepID=A0A0S0DXI8_9GAMA|nr:BLLF2 [macacine gammaherpesvirus 10]ALF03231.1 BLLF2 [macacine gammaherpesvirus 10]
MCPPVFQRLPHAPPAKRQALETVPHPQSRGQLRSPPSHLPKMQRRPRPPAARRRRFPLAPQQVERPMLPQNLGAEEAQNCPRMVETQPRQHPMQPPLYLPPLLARYGPAGLLLAHRLPPPKPQCRSHLQSSPRAPISPC